MQGTKVSQRLIGRCRHWARTTAVTATTAAAAGCIIALLAGAAIAYRGSTNTGGLQQRQRQQDHQTRRRHQFENNISTTTFAPYCPWCKDPVLCSRRFLFIIASGRSGSTTLMATMNSIPGIFLSGENDNEASRLRRIYEARMKGFEAATCFASSSSSSSSPHRCRQLPASSSEARRQWRRHELAWMQAWLWESNLPPSGLALATGIEPPQIVGFKEVRWTAEDARFIQAVAPCSRFIRNMRKNATAQARSGFFGVVVNQTTANAPPLASSLQRVQQANERTLRASQSIADPDRRLYTLHLEDFSVEAFARLAAWLGKPCRFSSIAHANANGTTLPKVVRPCVPE